MFDKYVMLYIRVLMSFSVRKPEEIHIAYYHNKNHNNQDRYVIGISGPDRKIFQGPLIQLWKLKGAP